MFCSMANPSRTMLEVSSLGVEKEEKDDEIELNLELSIGGSFKTPPKSKSIERNHINFPEKISGEGKLSREREMMENEVFGEERACKRGKKEECEEVKDLFVPLGENGRFDSSRGVMPYWTLDLGNKICKDGRDWNMSYPLRSVSVVSDHSSKSLQGDSSNDTKSHLCDSKPEHIACPNMTENSEATPKTVNYSENETGLISPKQQSKSIIQSDDPLKGASGEEGKFPAKPRACDSGIGSLLQMPCVSTTGNGPNGKTIVGFLCRYTKTGIGIVCGCHGSSFSPAEFVKHAGGKDILHPLKHITMISSEA